MYESYKSNELESYPASAGKPAGKKMGVKLAALVMAAALVAGTAGGAAGYVLGQRPEKDAGSEMADSLNNASATGGGTNATALDSSGLNLAPARDKQLTPADVYEQNVNAAVAIRAEGVDADRTNIWGQPTPFASSGSGFLVTSDGYVITNHHVIDQASAITVMLTSGESYTATLVGSDEENDVALLKIDGQNLPVVSIGDSDSLKVGDMVAAIGNPLGELTNTFTVGYVSALDREISIDNTSINMLQTDVAINSGNSGGPLFDMNGNVIGITSAKYASSSVEGLGFAIPINDAMYIVYDLYEYGYVTERPWMGVSVRDLDSVTASYYSLPAGVYVGDVTAGGAAEAAGIQAGDIIIRMGDRDINSYSALCAALRGYRAGDTAAITVYRAGKEVKLTIVFDERLPEEPADESTEAPTEGSGSQEGAANPFANMPFSWSFPGGATGSIPSGGGSPVAFQTPAA